MGLLQLALAPLNLVQHGVKFVIKRAQFVVGEFFYSGRIIAALRDHLGDTRQFEDRPGDPELGRLVESTVFVNEAHPAYRRALASRSEGYHIALAVALALAPLAAAAASEHAFVTAFLSRWGEALRPQKAGRGRRR